MGRPQTKAARHDAIRQLLSNRDIASQHQLAQLLQELDFDVTQATLSRDLLELRATKIRDFTGRHIYVLSNEQVADTSATALQKLARWCQELLVAAEVVENQLVMRTPAGAAQLLAAALDAAALNGVVGCVAGDDTLLAVCRSKVLAQKLRDKLLMMAENGVGDSN